MTLSLRALHAPLSPLATPRWRAKPCERLVHGLVMLPDDDRFVGAWEDGSLAVISRADGQLLARLEGHAGPVNCLRATPDGSRFLTGGDDRTVRLWDARSLRCIKVFEGHYGNVRDLDLTDTLAVTGEDDGQVCFWDLTTLTLRDKRTEQTSGLCALALSDDGAVVATASRSSEMFLWDAQSAAAPTRLASLPAGYESLLKDLTALRFLDGRRLVAGARDLFEFDAATGEISARYDQHGWWVNAIARHPARPLVAVARRGVGLYRSDTRARLVTLDRDGGHNSALCFTRDGAELLTGAQDGSLAAWDLDDALRCDGFFPHEDHVNRLVVGGERALTGSTDGSVHRWNLRDGRSVGPLDVRPVANGQPFGLSPSGEVSLTTEPGVAFWRGDARTPMGAVLEVDKTPLRSYSVALVNDTQAIVGPTTGPLGVCEARDDATAEFAPLQGATQLVMELARSRDGRFLATLGFFENPETKRKEEARALARAEAEMLKWAASTGKRARKVKQPWVSVESVMHLQLWDLSARALRWSCPVAPAKDQHPFAFNFARFLSTGELVSCAEDAHGVLRVRSVDGVVVRDIPFEGDHLQRVEMLENDVLAALSTRDERYRMIQVDLIGAKVVHSVEIAPAVVSFRRDGALAAVHRKGSVDFVSTRDGSLHARYASDARILYGAISPDGTRWIGGDASGQVHILALEGVDATRPEPACEALPAWEKPAVTKKKRATKKKG